MLEGEQTTPDNVLFIDDSARNCEVAASLGIMTLNPANGGDWRPDVFKILNIPL
jgi:putative hydrolase of the HAD superfamily